METKKFPEIFEECDSILSLPQYWGWKFTGKKVSEISYIGCHSYLWSPMRNSQALLQKKVDKKFPNLSEQVIFVSRTKN